MATVISNACRVGIWVEAVYNRRTLVDITIQCASATNASKVIVTRVVAATLATRMAMRMGIALTNTIASVMVRQKEQQPAHMKSVGLA